MAFLIKKFELFSDDKKFFHQFFEDCDKISFHPLIKSAKKRYLETIFETEANFSNFLNEPHNVRYQLIRTRTGKILRRRVFSRTEGETLNGDFFFTPEKRGLIYIILTNKTPTETRIGDEEIKDKKYRIEIGFFGEDSEIINLSKFFELLDKYSKNYNLKEFIPKNKKFIELKKNEDNKFLLATEIEQKEIDCSNVLKDQIIREIALNLRKSGGLLENNLVMKKGTSIENIYQYLQPLVDSSLIIVDYVVVCNQTNKQINRAKDLKSLHHLDTIGVTCSCGKKISEERIEKLYSPQPLLQKMLDKSFWMSAHLIFLLQKLGIPKDNILINLAEGPEEIDAIVDIEGFLLMFELKDNEFSMGHAYPFQARISIYSPNYSIIVATKGVSNDVKNHFVRAKPETEMNYVDNLDELEEMLRNLIFKIRSQRAFTVLTRFDNIASMEMPLSLELAKKFSIEVNVENLTQ